MKGQTEGRIVHYIIAGHEYPGASQAAGQHRPALIVKSWSPGCVNALLFLDGSNDGKQDGVNPVWLTSISEGEGPAKWHEPERLD